MNWSNPLPFDKLSSIAIPTQGGVYAFLDANNRVVYIGQTSDLHQRFLDYCNGENECVMRKANYFTYIPATSEIVRKSLEEKFIREYQPPCNDQLK